MDLTQLLSSLRKNLKGGKLSLDDTLMGITNAGALFTEICGSNTLALTAVPAITTLATPVTGTTTILGQSVTVSILFKQVHDSIVFTLTASLPSTKLSILLANFIHNSPTLPTVSLSDLTVTLSSITNSLCCQGSATNVNIGLTTIAFSLFKLDVKEIGTFNFLSATFSGNYTQGSITLPVSITIPLGAGNWMMNLGSTKNPITLTALTDLSAFIDGDTDTLSALPADLQALGFGISDFEISFNDQTKSIPGVALTLESTQKWTLIQNVLEIDALRLSLGIQRYGYVGGKKGKKSSWTSKKISWDVFGTIGLGSVTTNINVGCNAANLSIAITPVDGMSLADLTQLLGGTDLTSHLPKGLNILDDIKISYLALDINVTTRTITSLSLSLQTKNHWSIIPHWLTVSALNVGITVYNPATKATRQVAVDIVGQIAFDTIEIYVNGQLPNGQFLATIADMSVNDISKNFLPAGTTLPEEISDLALANIQLMLDPSQSSYSISAMSAGTWVIIPSDLSLTNLLVDINHNGEDGSTLYQLHGNVVIEGLSFFISGDNSSGSWVFTGSLQSTIKLSDLIQSLLGFTAPPLIPDVTLDGLSITVNKGTKEYQFSCQAEIDWSANTIGTITLPKFMASINIQSLPGTSSRTYSGHLSGDTILEGEKISIRYEFAPGSKDIIATYDGFRCTIKEQPSPAATVIELQMGNLSLGALIDYVAQKIAPGASLQSPWDVLNDINLHDLILKLNLTDDSGGVWFDGSENLEFFTIHGVGITYQKASTGKPKAINIQIAGNFLGKTYPKNKPLQWNMLQGNGPAVTGKGSALLDLRYMGLGQHISFKSTKQLDTVHEVLQELGDAYKTKSSGTPAGNPLASIKALEYDTGSSWLIGTDLTLIDTVTVGVIFNDPKIYGLYLALSGKRAKIFSGLKFQILYKKISNTLGEYYLQLQLPVEMRHMDFGEVAITLPTFTLTIFTNGNFTIDFGFPKNLNFSQSFGIQAFPFTGAGGFYFGVLDGATSSQVPKISNGNFNPVIAFGIGLNIGLGKNLQLGILTGDIAVTVDGVVQGCIGFFHPNNPVTERENFYRLQGTIEIVAKVHGTVNFYIIKASLSVVAYASAQVVIESHMAIEFDLHAGVSLQLSVHIAFIHIHLHFNKTVSEHFTIGSNSTPPWHVITPSPVQSPRQSMLLGEADRMPETLLSSPAAFNWSTAASKWTNKYYSAAKTVDLKLCPSITLSGAAAQAVALLFIENDTVPSPSNPFNTVCEAMLAFTLEAWYQVATPADLKSTSVTVQDLSNILTACETAFSSAELNAFLEANLTFSIGAPPSATDPTFYGSVFPMLPCLTLDYTGATNPVDFSTVATNITPTYLNNITTYCDLLMGGIPAKNIATAESMATFVFHDYFNFMVKEGVEHALNLLKTYQHTVSSTDTLKTLAQTYAVTNHKAMQHNIALANATKSVLSTTVALNINGFSCPADPTQTLSTLASSVSSSVSANQLAATNRFVEHLLVPGQAINTPSITYTIPSPLTISDVATNFYTTSDYVRPLSNAVNNGTTNLLPLTKIAISNIDFAATAALNSVTTIAQYFNITPAAILALNSSLTITETITTGTAVTIPDIIYITPPTDVHSTKIYFNGTLTGNAPTLTISAATYIVQKTDTLANIAYYLSTGMQNITVEDIVTNNPGLKLLPATLQFPDFAHSVSPTDTLQSIADTYGCTVTTLAENNNTQAIFNSESPAAIITIPNASLKFATILTKLASEAAFTKIATTLSRFFLYGLRLPTPGQTFPSPANSSSWATLTTSGLYELTGQQFPAPTVASPTITLISSKPSWVTTSSELSGTGLPFSATQLAEITALPAATTSFLSPTAVNTYKQAPARFTLQHPIYWTSSEPLPYQSKTGVDSLSGGPVLWPFSADLQSAVAKITEPLLQTGQHLPGKKQMQTQPVDYYAWATTLRFEIKKVSGSNGIYAIVSVDAADQDLLKQLLSQDALSINFAYKGGNGLLSDIKNNTDKHGVLLLKTNLALESVTKTITKLLLNVNSSFFPSLWGGKPVQDLKGHPPVKGCYTMSAPEIFSDTDKTSRLAYMVDFTGTTGQWGTVAWVPPTGESPSIPPGAKNITFWAAGKAGGEVVHFGFGAKPEYKYRYVLTDSWKKYTIELPAEYTATDFQDGGQTAAFYWACGAGDNSGNISFAIAADPQGITFTKPEQETLQEPTPPPYAATLDQAQDFLTILSQSDRLKATGYYLSYTTTDNPNGLPESAFQTTDTATVYLIVSSSQSLSPYHNSVVTKGAIDLRSKVFFLEAQKLNRWQPKFPAGHVGWELINTKTIPSPPPSDITVLLDVDAGFIPSGWEPGGGYKAEQCKMTPTPAYADSQGTKKKAQVINFTTTGTGWLTVLWKPTRLPGPTIPENATAITFWAVGKTGTEKPQFGYFNGTNVVKWPDPVTPLSTTWTQYTMELPAGFTPGQSPFLWAYGGTTAIEFAIAVDTNDIAYIKPTDGLPNAYVQNCIDQLFHLMGYQLTNATGTTAKSVEGLPIGPTALPADKITQEVTNANSVYYHQVLPLVAPQPADSTTFTATPPAAENPYSQIGQELYIKVSAQDIFGNSIPPSGQPTALPIQFYDRLIGIKNWPNAAASYLFNLSNAGKTQISIFLDFAVKKYTPTASRSFVKCMQHAASDQKKYAQIYYQLNAPDTSIAVESSMGTLKTQPTVADLTGFVSSAYAYLGTLTYLANKDLLKGHQTSLTTPGAIIDAYYCDPQDLGEQNQTIQGVFNDTAVQLPKFYNVPFNNTLKSVCAAALSHLSLTITPSQLVTQLANAALLTPKTVLIITTDPIKTYTVQPNDTFQSIVSQFTAQDLTLDLLATQNAKVDNIFLQNARIKLTTTTVASTTTDELSDYLAMCSGEPSLAELLDANASTTLGSTQWTVPETVMLSTSSTAHLCITTSSKTALSSLSAIAANNVVSTAIANQQLLNILDKTASFTLSPTINGTSPTLTITVRSNETLNTLYHYIIEKIVEKIPAGSDRIDITIGSISISQSINDKTDIKDLLKNDISFSACMEIIATQNIIAKNSVLLVPPGETSFSSSVTANTIQDSQAITASCTITRTGNLDANSANVPEIATVTTALNPHLQNNAAPAGSDLSLKAFATTCETAFDNTVKIAVGKDQNGHRALMAVPLGSAISYSVDPVGPVFFAPTPLTNTFLSRSNVPLQAYKSGHGLYTVPAKNFAKVDLDAWAQAFLVTVDDFLNPDSAVAAYNLDPHSYSDIVSAKQQIAQAIANSVKPILQEPDNEEWLNQQLQAQDSLYTELLNKLVTAYEVEAIVGQTLNVVSTSSNTPILFGKPSPSQYTIGTVNTLTQIATDLATSNNPVTVGYVGQVLADVTGLLLQETITIGTTPEVVGASDTLTTMAKKFSLSCSEFVTKISSKPYLAPGKTINLAWIMAKPSTWSLTQLAEYFSCTPADIVNANMDATGILHKGTIIPAPTPYTLKATDKFSTVLTKPTVTEEYLVNVPNLFTDSDLGILSLQPSCTLSTASVPLQNGKSFLTYMLSHTQGKAMDAKCAFFDMQYQINYMEENNESFSFVTPPKALKLGTTCVPLPLRKCPTPPTLLKQSAQFKSTITTIEDAKEWSYDLSYVQHDQDQDELRITANFNGTAPDSQLSGHPGKSSQINTNTSAGDPGQDLLQTLAEFMETYQTLAPDLATVAEVKNTPALQPNAKIALNAFSNVVKNVAAAWSAWCEDKQVTREEKTSFGCVISEYTQDTDLNIAVTKISGNLPGPYSLPLITADPSCWTPVTPFTPPATGTDTVLYSFTPVARPVIANINKRKASFSKLDLIQIQSIWAGVSLSRNRDLIVGRQTTSDFVYTTPDVRFISKIAPTLVTNTAIPISEIVSLDPTNTTPQIRTLQAHLSALFEVLLEMGLNYQTNKHFYIKITCNYSFGLNAQESTPLISDVPVLLHPGISFNIHDWEITSLTQESFVQRLANAIDKWQKTHTPETQDAYYTFDLAVFTGTSKAQKILNFLTENNTANLPGSLSRTAMPLSFYVPNDYWITKPDNQEQPYTLDSYAERVLAYYGADIYDVATMQIALSLYPDYKRGMTVANHWTKRLRSGFSGTLGDYQGENGTIRGWTTSNSPFKYGGSTPLPMPSGGMQASGAYFFRMISDQYQLSDPLTGDHLWPGDINPHHPHKENGKPIKWIDWKPITGENAWAAFIGPLQLLYRKTGQLPRYNSDEMRLALSVLPAYEDMQWVDPGNTTKRGAIYYAPQGTAANVAGHTVNPYEVSNENNFSSYAGLTILMQVLSSCYVRETVESTKQEIAANFTKVQTIASGIKAYFIAELYNTHATPPLPNEHFKVGKCFYTGGQYGTESTGNTGSFTGGGKNFQFAVDVHTWGCSVLGVENVDTWFGKNTYPGVTVYSLWQIVKAAAGYFRKGKVTNEILGVGYTNVASLAKNKRGGHPDPIAEKDQHKYIISAEWTFGAINMCKVAAAQYRSLAKKAIKTSDQNTYNQYASSLEADAATMLNGVEWLLLDTSRDAQDIYAYYYANRRYDIPFGWHANRVDSLCSTSWSLMVENEFNPFILGGDYQTQVIDPDTYTVTSWTPPQFPPAKENKMYSFDQAGVPEDQQKLLNFLIVNNTKNLGDPPSAFRTGLPLSFYAPKDYWTTPPNNQAGPNSYDAIIERCLAYYGADIYDVATAQCALSIFPALTPGMVVGENQTKRLLSGFSMPNVQFPTKTPSRPPGSTIRGWTNVASSQSSQFYYGSNKTALFPEEGDNASAGAYFFRMIADQFLMTDPLTKATTFDSKPLAWTDWKPITGENAWAVFIGPLQIAYSRYGGIPPLDSDAVQLGLKVLPAYQAMTSPDGSIYYAPWNTAGNVADTFVDPLMVSNENNFSSYAGLTMLQQALDAGGDSENLAIVNRLLAGIEKYFEKCLFNKANDCFYTQGSYNKDDSKGNPTNTLGKFVGGGPGPDHTETFAVDVHTWGCTVLGVEKVDSWFGTHKHPKVSVYSLWQNVKDTAGYFENGDPSQKILGVGYSNVPVVDGHKQYDSVISAEWTFGAINMCLVIADQYDDPTNPFYNPLWATSLRKDAATMTAGVKDIMLDMTSRSDDTQAYYYTNRRYHIPFGWWGNRIDSLCSTAWGIMVANQFNPFVLGGGTQKQVPSPKKSTLHPFLELKNLQLDKSDICT